MRGTFCYSQALSSLDASGTAPSACTLAVRPLAPGRFAAGRYGWPPRDHDCFFAFPHGIALG
eukprot:scaffold43453_cov75-Phaeocystis_antarctica.AAC.5